MKIIPRIYLFISFLTLFGTIQSIKAEEMATFKNDSLRIQINAPKDWDRDKSTNADVDLQLTSPSKEYFIQILAEKKANSSSKSLEKYSEITRNLIASRVTLTKQEGPKKLTINGHPALQYKLFVTAKSGTNFTYLHTAIETSTYYYQVLDFTLASLYDAQNSLFEQITQSFKAN